MPDQSNKCGPSVCADIPPIAFSIHQSYEKACQGMKDLLELVEEKVSEEAKGGQGQSMNTLKNMLILLWQSLCIKL